MTMKKQSHLWKYIISVLSLVAGCGLWWLVEHNRPDCRLNRLKKGMMDRRELFFAKENPNPRFSEDETTELTDLEINSAIISLLQKKWDLIADFYLYL